MSPRVGVGAAWPEPPARAGCWRLFTAVTASGCCRSVEPKETAARASTVQDGGSCVSVSVCGRGWGRAGRGAPFWSCPAGGGRQGLGSLRAGGTRGQGTGASKGPIRGLLPYAPPRGSSPALRVQTPGGQARRAGSAGFTPAARGVGVRSSSARRVDSSLVGSPKGGAQKSLGRRLGTVTLRSNKPCLRLMRPGRVGRQTNAPLPQRPQVALASIQPARVQRSVRDLGLPYASALVIESRCPYTPPHPA